MAPWQVATAQRDMRGHDMAASVTHFEIYAEEPAVLAEFYRILLGWEIEKPPGVDYWRIRTDPTNAPGFDGGLTYRPSSSARQWVRYVRVESLDAAIQQVQRLGGQLLQPKTAVPRAAWYAFVADPAGNIFALWQPDETALPVPEPD
jgi:predicted enzyme related to lactoylglutathione lyase